ncbi:MAG: FmdB family transcriptional regulator [Pseudonocardia sp.]|nr:FmdB family transcriptional regulator [Pseudonocardia sp.]
MPTYQYACTTCDHRFEAVQAFTDTSLTDCPQCSGLLRKVFSSVGIVFKGSGFYRTDSRAGAVVNGESKPAGSTTETKSDTAAKGSDGASSSSSSSGKSDSGSSTSSNGTPAKSAAKS